MHKFDNRRSYRRDGNVRPSNPETPKISNTRGYHTESFMEIFELYHELVVLAGSLRTTMRRGNRGLLCNL